MRAVEKALKNVQQVAEQIRNDELAVVGTTSPGDVVRQGDLYLVCVTGKLQRTKLTRTSNKQLAPGTSQGSRHIMEGMCDVLIGDVAKLAAIINNLGFSVSEGLIGPVVQILGDAVLTHPEHGDRTLPKKETFVVVYQRAFADEIRRQLD